MTCRANTAKVNFREKEKKILDQILGQGKYDARIRPSGINGTGELSLVFAHISAPVMTFIKTQFSFRCAIVRQYISMMAS